MDAGTSSRLRERRAHRRVQIAENRREMVMKEFEEQESSQQDKEKAPQMKKEIEGHMGSQGIIGTIK